jgi:FAD:protein FMN transferase
MTADMTTNVHELALAALWRRVSAPGGIAVAERDALGTTARIAVWPPDRLDRASAAVDDVLKALDQQASRFRSDSEISWIHRGNGGLFMLSDGLAEAVGVALAAARWTGGLTDPTVGTALVALGYDRDFAAIDARRPDPPVAVPVPGWQAVRLDGHLLRLPAEVQLDLGATAKGLGSDRAAWAALAASSRSAGDLAGGGPPGGRPATDCPASGVLISLGGDIAVAGTPPQGGWPVTVADGPDPAGSARTQLIRLSRGAVATSSVTCRSWHRAGQDLHHIVDPATGRPADGPWQTVSVAAATCADANAASTAAIVAGHRAHEWLELSGLPARLVSRDGMVQYLGGWPDTDGAAVPVPSGTRVYAGARRRGGGR